MLVQEISVIVKENIDRPIQTGLAFGSSSRAQLRPITSANDKSLFIRSIAGGRVSCRKPFFGPGLPLRV